MNGNKSVYCVFAFIFCLAFVSFLTFIVWVNYSVDVSGIYLKDDSPRLLQYKQYAKLLLNSKHGLGYIPPRRFKYELAHLSDAACYVTGSSHIMQLSTLTVPGLKNHCPSFINLGVDAATVEDHVSLLFGIAQNPSLKTIFISVEPWLFKRTVNKHWMVYEKEHRKARTFFGLSMKPYEISDFDSIKLFYNLFSWDYFVRNIQQFSNPTVDKSSHNISFVEIKPSIDTDNPDHSIKLIDNSVVFPLKDSNSFLSDGTLLYPQGYSKERQNKPLPLDAGGSRTSWPNYYPEVIEDLKTVILFFENRHVNVVLLITPYHPGVFPCRDDKICNALNEIEGIAANLAKETGAEVIGGYMPTPYGLKSIDFDDDEHLSLGGLSKFSIQPRTQ